MAVGPPTPNLNVEEGNTFDFFLGPCALIHNIEIGGKGVCGKTDITFEGRWAIRE